MKSHIILNLLHFSADGPGAGNGRPLNFFFRKGSFRKRGGRGGALVRGAPRKGRRAGGSMPRGGAANDPSDDDSVPGTELPRKRGGLFLPGTRIPNGEKGADASGKGLTFRFRRDREERECFPFRQEDSCRWCRCIGSCRLPPRR